MSGEVAQVAGEAGRTETGRAEAGRAEEAGQASAVVRTTTTFEELLEQDVLTDCGIIDLIIYWYF